MMQLAMMGPTGIILMIKKSSSFQNRSGQSFSRIGWLRLFFSVIHFLDDIENAGNFRARPLLTQTLECLRSQLLPHMAYHIEQFPPAVKNLKAGPPVFFAAFTV
jgi:hypothetical protein